MNKRTARPWQSTGSGYSQPGNARPRTASISTPWQLAQRCEDECARDEESSFALLVVEPGQDAAHAGRIPEVLSNGLRRADVVAELGTNRYAVLLSGAGRYDAGRVASRIRQSIPADIGVAVFPQDGATLAELVMAALASMGRSSELAS